MSHICLVMTNKPTDLQRIFDRSDPVQLLATLEFIWTPIGQAGIQPAAGEDKETQGYRRTEWNRRNRYEIILSIIQCNKSYP